MTRNNNLIIKKSLFCSVKREISSLFFSESDLFRPHIDHVFRNDDVVEADAARVQRVAPFVLVPVQEPKHYNGNPAVNENGINQQIQPGFKGSANLPQHRYRENVLAHADDLPNLDGQHLVQHVGVKGHQVVNVRAEHKEG